MTQLSKQISFPRFPNGLSRQDVIAEMKRAAREGFPECKPVVPDSRHTGTHGKREATLNACVEFWCPDVHDATFKALGKDASITVEDTNVRVKPAKTRVNAHRAMRNMTAARVQGYAAALAPTVEIVKGNHQCVKVDGNVGFGRRRKREATTASLQVFP